MSNVFRKPLRAADATHVKQWNETTTNNDPLELSNIKLNSYLYSTSKS